MQGRAAIYSTRSEEDDDGITAPLLSWRAHKGWVSEVQFVSLGGTSVVEGNGTAGSAGSRVLTAANDAAVKVRRRPCITTTPEGGQAMPPVPSCV